MPPRTGSPRTAARAPRDAARTRESLLDAGVAVAERGGLSGLSVNRVVAEAGVAKGTFYVHFSDREAFVDALHARFHERVEQAVALATAGTEPGAEQIWRGAEAYLDVCLADRAIKALALEARTDGALTAPMAARIERFTASAVPSFRAMGWPDAKAAAQLFAAMTSEIAIRELEAGRRVPGARRALRRFLGADA
ncbi:MAG TPA: helix-turn-helix domain-containing protein [Solirubrobacteraceae bacterium]|jgi:AcrR family transcriptional regulator|nr:helix-turn-helix domain-containing protein [Solirubrobacteraceae bacterium]